MKSFSSKTSGRRGFLQGFGGALGAGFWADQTLDALPQNVNTNSKPSALKITDLRVATVARAPMTCPLIRIDTNQGVYGLGEVRDGASKNYALMLKSRILISSGVLDSTQITRSSLLVGVRISQPVSVTTTVSSIRMPPKSSR